MEIHPLQLYIPPFMVLASPAAPCDWFGVACRPDQPSAVTADIYAVAKLNLPAAGLNGTLVGLNFSSLPTSPPSTSRETRPIPHTIGRLSRLSVLHFGSNNLTGMIPQEISDLGSLSVLNLSSNSLIVPIPSFVANFSQLASLDLSGLNLAGRMEELFVGRAGLKRWNFSSLPNMQYLFLRDNYLSGRLPPFFCTMNSLRALDLSRNRLSSEIPSCWWEMKALQMMILESNHLSGRVPLSSNGIMPPLLSLHLANNSMTGEFPLALENCKELVILDLGDNKFVGDIPTWVGDSFPSLKILRLRSNMFRGVIPPQLSRLGKLQLLDLAHNNLTGRIPSSFGNLTAMAKRQQVALLDGSRFTYMESIMIVWKGAELSFQQNLALVTGIDLSSNSLSQAIPTELTNISGLLFLNLSETI
uniref:Uncharacterized protein n=1 Tax=Ananas comosus var. bracteatus TaxID=296719 RepID=A0A6V7PZF4_ANACO|nr:unnamed protein product [Ananas comosus var. bracteatus]